MNSCPVCNDTKITSSTLGSVPLLHCLNCDVHVLKHPPGNDMLNHYYSTTYAMSANEILASEHRRLFRLPEQYWLISQLEKHGLKAGDSICDIGCDKGYFLDQCRRFGFQVQGVEPSEQAREYCKSIGLSIEADLSLIQSKYKAITLWHVLEHFTQPQSLIASCHSLLEQHGLLFIRVPDFASCWSRVLRSKWIWFQAQNHYVHYSHKSLRLLIEQQGFDVLTCMSRKPNDMQTHKAGLLADKTLRRSFSYTQSLKKRLGRIYEHVTGVEIFLIAKKK